MSLARCFFIPFLRKDGENMANGNSFTATLKADSGPFKKGVDEAVTKLTELNKKLVDNQYQQKDCNKAISDAKKELKKLQDQIGQNGTATEDEKKKIEQLNDTIEQEKLKLSQLKAEQAGIKSLISETSKELSENNDQWTVLKGTLANLASDTLEKLGSKLLSIGKDIIQTGEQFSSSMSEVQAISGATGEELQQLEEAARLYGSTTQFSATEAADALKYMALAGWDAQTSMEALPGVLDLAAASGMELATAADMVTDYLSAFGMQAEQASYMADLLTYAQGNSNTSAQQLGEAFGNCAANLSAAGQDIETVTSLLEAMANQGLKGSEAGTALTAMMRDITNKMEDGKIAIGATSVTVQDASGNFRDLTDILTDVEKAISGLGTAEQASALSATFTANSIKGVNLVLNEGITAVSGYEEALRSSTGAASDAAETMNDNLTGDIKQLDSALDELKLKIFDDAESPLRGIVQTITEKGVPALESLINNIDKLIPIVISATTVMVSYKAAISIQSIINGVKQGITQLTAAKAAEAVATTAEAAATNGATSAQIALNTAQAANPIGLLVSAISGLIALMISLAATTSSSTSAIQEFNTAIEQIDSTAQETVASAESEAAVVKRLGEEYDTLRQKESLNEAEQIELKNISEQLAKKLGITTEELKTQSGTYADLSQKIDEYCEKLIKEAELEAATEAYKEAIKAKLALLEEYNKKRDEYIEKGEIVVDSDGNFIYKTEESMNELKAFSNKMDEAEKKCGYYADAMAEVAKETEDTGSAANTATEEVAAYSSEVKKAETTVTEAFTAMKDAASYYDTVLDEVNSNGSISVATISTLMSKYPELTDVLNEYVAGLKSEHDVLTELEKVYETDVENWKKALLSKKSADEDFYESTIKTNADLVNELKNQYGIDLNNFKSLAQVKVALLKKLKEEISEINNEWSSIFSVSNTNGTQELHIGNQLIARNNGGGWQVNTDTSDPRYSIQDRQELLNEYLSYLSDRDSKIDDYFDPDSVIARNWNPTTVTTTGSGKNTSTTTSGGGSSGGSSGSGSKTRTIRYAYKGEEYASSYNYNDGDDTSTLEADATAKAQLGVLDRAKNLGKVTTEEEVGFLKRLLEIEKLSADERYEIKKRLYTAEQTLADETADTIIEKQNLAYAAYKKLVEDKKATLKAEAQAVQDEADAEIAAIEEKIAARAREQDDAKRQSQLDEINAKLQYDRLTEFERRELLKKKQSILNEQADVDFDRQMAAEKAGWQAKSDAAQDIYNASVDKLTESLNAFADRLSYLQGTQSNDQKVQNNSQTVNIQIVQNGMDGDQVIAKIMKEFGAI